MPSSVTLNGEEWLIGVKWGDIEQGEPSKQKQSHCYNQQFVVLICGSSTKIHLFLLKLDGVGPVDNRPSTD